MSDYAPVNTGKSFGKSHTKTPTKREDKAEVNLFKDVKVGSSSNINCSIHLRT